MQLADERNQLLDERARMLADLEEDTRYGAEQFSMQMLPSIHEEEDDSKSQV